MVPWLLDTLFESPCWKHDNVAGLLEVTEKEQYIFHRCGGIELLYGAHHSLARYTMVGALGRCEGLRAKTLVSTRHYQTGYCTPKHIIQGFI